MCVCVCVCVLLFFGVLAKKTSTHFIIRVYRKPTFTGLYLSWDTYALKSRNINLIKPLSAPLDEMMTYSGYKVDDKLKKLTNIFFTNGDRKSIILSHIKFTIFKFHHSKTFGLPKCFIYIKIPWVGLSSHFFADKISLSIMH